MDNLMGEKIRLLISQNGISQKELAKNAGITESAISHYISGNRVPKGAILLKIAKKISPPNSRMRSSIRETTIFK